MPYSTVHLAVAATCIFIVSLWNGYRQRSKPDHRLPPGPVGLPLLGNLLQVPRTVRTFLSAGTGLSVYCNPTAPGDVLQALVGRVWGPSLIEFGWSSSNLDWRDEYCQGTIREACIQAFLAPSVSRHHIDPALDLWALGEESKTFTTARKLTAGIMSDVRAGKTDKLHEFEATLNIQHLLDDGGEECFHHINRVAASVVLSATFGMHCPTGHEPALKNLLDILEELMDLANPTSTIINFFPFLDIIPGPMPWRTRAQSFRKRQDELYATLIDEALTGKASGMNTWAATFASKDKPEGDQRRLLKLIATAAVETTATSLQTFLLACICYPEWMATAHNAIDKVVGYNRLPTFKDRDSLPYVEAIVRETLRWRPAVRHGIPHMSTANDTIQYKGQEYFIPKGSIIFAVTMAIEHDQSRYEDHDRFMPERFLDSEGKLKPDYETSAFGFGRRSCQGIPFGVRTLWINIAMLLWTFNIQASDKVDPKTALPFQYDDSDAAFNGDFTNPPLKFPVVFEPRSPERVEVARRQWSECEKDLNILLPAPKDS